MSQQAAMRYSPSALLDATITSASNSTAALDPTYANESHTARFLAITTIIHVLALTFVALRLYCRIWLLKTPGKDDWFILGSVASFFPSVFLRSKDLEDRIVLILPSFLPSPA